MGMILPPDGSSDEEPVECIAFTRPSLRRRGYFAALLEKACDISGEHDILFPVDPESADTAATMKAIHADRVDQEYQMKWDFDPAAERFDSPMVEKRPLTFTCTSAPEGDVNESVDPDSCWDCFHSADCLLYTSRTNFREYIIFFFFFKRFPSVHQRRHGK